MCAMYCTDISCATIVTVYADGGLETYRWWYGLMTRGYVPGRYAAARGVIVTLSPPMFLAR